MTSSGQRWTRGYDIIRSAMFGEVVTSSMFTFDYNYLRDNDDCSISRGVDSSVTLVYDHDIIKYMISLGSERAGKPGGNKCHDDVTTKEHM